MASTIKKVALIGAGYMASEYCKSIALTNGLSLVGIHSKTKQKAKLLADKFAISTVADSIEQLYNETLADAVIIAVPELSARNVILEAFDYPWTTLIEKPPGYLPIISRELLVKSESLARKSFVALNRRFYSSTSKAFELLSTDSSQRTIIIQDQEDQNAALSIGQPREVVEAWMYANSIHIIDYAFLFCRGSVTKIMPVINFKPFQASVQHSIIEFSSGDRAIYTALWQQPGPWSVQICTEKQRLELRPLEQLSVQEKGQRAITQLPIENIDIECKAGLRGLCENLQLALSNQNHRLPSLAEGIQIMDYISDIYDLKF